MYVISNEESAFDIFTKKQYIQGVHCPKWIDTRYIKSNLKFSKIKVMDLSEFVCDKNPNVWTTVKVKIHK